MKMQMQMSNMPSKSPYYKGLTDQSLAILNDTAAASTSASSSCHAASASRGYSPYYKGLMDYSLVIGSWAAALQWHPATSPATTNSFSFRSNPYYRGLIDYSLALHGPQVQLPPHLAPHNDSPTLNQLMTEIGDDDVVDDDDDGGFVTEKKQPRERVSEEESTVGSATKGAGDDDLGLVIEEKPLEETVSETEAGMVESVMEENVDDKTSSREMELMTKGLDDDDDGDDFIMHTHHEFLPFSSTTFHRHVKSELNWCPPSPGWVKLNVVGSVLHANDGTSGCGGLLRSETGDWLLGFSIRSDSNDVLAMELGALRIGLTLAWDKGFRNICCETGCLQAHYLLQSDHGVVMMSSPDEVDLLVLVAEIKSLLRRPWNVQLRRVLHSANMAADYLANLASKNGVDMQWWSSPPPGIQSVLRGDTGPHVF